MDPWTSWIRYKISTKTQQIRYAHINIIWILETFQTQLEVIELVIFSGDLNFFGDRRQTDDTTNHLTLEHVRGVMNRISKRHWWTSNRGHAGKDLAHYLQYRFLVSCMPRILVNCKLTIFAKSYYPAKMLCGPFTNSHLSHKYCYVVFVTLNHTAFCLLIITHLCISHTHKFHMWINHTHSTFVECCPWQLLSCRAWSRYRLDTG